MTSNIATVTTNNNNVPISECFHVSWYTKQTSDYSKARIKSLLTWKSRRQSLCSELKVLMANVMASNLPDDMALSIKLEAICITTHLPHDGSIYYTVILNFHVWCPKVLLTCGMQAEYMYVAIFILGAGISVDFDPALQVL